MLNKLILGAMRKCGYEPFKESKSTRNERLQVLHKKPAVNSEVVVASRDQPRNVHYKYPWLSWLIPAALCTVMFGQLFFSAVNYRKPLMKQRTFTPATAI